MNETLVLVLIVAAAFAFLILKYKFEKGRYADVLLDIAIMSALTYMFHGTFTGMVVAVGASVLVSLYLLVFPPKFLSFLNIEKETIMKQIDDLKKGL